MTYIIITIISIIILTILIIWKSIINSKRIAYNVHGNIERQQQTNEKTIQKEQILSELRLKFLEAQKNGIDRIAYINELKKELEEYLAQDEDEEQFTY